MCEDPSKAADILTSKLTAILDQMAPIKTIQVRANYAPWLSAMEPWSTMKPRIR